jgi:hypothetical protein
MADATAVIRALGAHLAQAIVDRTIAEVEVAELREREAARAAIESGEAVPVADMEPAE